MLVRVDRPQSLGCFQGGRKPLAQMKLKPQLKRDPRPVPDMKDMENMLEEVEVQVPVRAGVALDPQAPVVPLAAQLEQLRALLVASPVEVSRISTTSSWRGSHRSSLVEVEW